MQKAMDKFSMEVVEIMAKNTNLEDEILRYKHQLTCYAHYYSLTHTKVREAETKYTNARLECDKLKEEVEELRAKPCKLQMLVKMICDKERECIKLKQQVEELNWKVQSASSCHCQLFSSSVEFWTEIDDASPLTPVPLSHLQVGPHNEGSTCQ